MIVSMGRCSKIKGNVSPHKPCWF